MRMLFIDNDSGSHFIGLAEHFAANENAHNVVFASHQRSNISIDNALSAVYNAQLPVSEHTHFYNRPLERSVKTGQELFRLAVELQRRHFVPDVICAHGGQGSINFIHDLWPKVPIVAMFDWFYSTASEMFQMAHDEPEPDVLCQARTRNLPTLMDLYICQRAFVRTEWQKMQFPSNYHDKLQVVHTGVDTEKYAPFPYLLPALRIPSAKLEFPAGTPVIAYSAPGLEKAHGFETLMKAVARLQKEEEKLQVIIVAKDQAFHEVRDAEDKRKPSEKLFEAMGDEIDQERVHILSQVAEEEWVRVLQFCAAYVYLEWPFILNDVLLRAMSTGCAVVASDTAPVQGVVEDGVNGWLVPFEDDEALAAKVTELLKPDEAMIEVRRAARKTAVEQYSNKTQSEVLAKLLQEAAWSKTGHFRPDVRLSTRAELG